MVKVPGKPIIVSYSDGGGGAERAAYRLQQALLSSGMNSRMRVAVKTKADRTVMGPTTRASRVARTLRSRVGIALASLQRTENSVLHSVAALPSSLPAELNAMDADIVNLHWIGGEMLSVEDVAKINKPVVWTLHDSWAFCGSEHHPALDDFRYRDGYSRGNRPASDGGLDIDRWTWRRKRRAWRSELAVVTPSQWLAQRAAESVIMREWPITVIPNPLPLDIYRPWDQQLARQLFRLPAKSPLILFGAFSGAGSSLKGWDLLAAAIPLVAKAIPDARVVLVGADAGPRAEEFGLPQYHVGHLSDDQSLAMLNSAVDVVVVPSRIENLPQSATEAIACGTPVVAFNCGGLPEIVDHKDTGYLATPYDTRDLAHGIVWVLEDAGRHRRLRVAARHAAVARWSPASVAAAYAALFAQRIEDVNVNRDSLAWTAAAGQKGF